MSLSSSAYGSHFLERAAERRLAKASNPAGRRSLGGGSGGGGGGSNHLPSVGPPGAGHRTAPPQMMGGGGHHHHSGSAAAEHYRSMRGHSRGEQLRGQSRGQSRGQPRGQSRGGLRSRGGGGGVSAAVAPGTPSRRDGMGSRQRRQLGHSYGSAAGRSHGYERQGFGSDATGGGGGAGQLPGLGWQDNRRDRPSRSRGGGGGGGGGDYGRRNEDGNDWRRKTMNIRNGLPMPIQRAGEADEGSSPRKGNTGHHHHNSNTSLTLDSNPSQSSNSDTKISIGSKSIGGKYPPGMFLAGAGKKENQDDWFTQVANNGDFVVGVLDGHGLNGKTVSNYCKRQLSKRMGQLIGVGGGTPVSSAEVEQQVAEAIAGTSAELLRSVSRPFPPWNRSY
eukprot:COSAG01_NODE_1555_length_9928_cov_20.399837_4_plen_390_part_00